jgi:phage repressor protein C with HTH and peptisase S24 domain
VFTVNKSMNTVDNDKNERGQSTIADRLSLAMGETAPATLARIAKISPQSLSDYKVGKSKPKSEQVFVLADILGVNPRWLATGSGSMRNDDETALIMIPRYDVKLSAGAGTWNDRAKQIGALAFQRSYLAKLGSPNGENLIVLGSRGDSMAPTLRDDASVLVQTGRLDWEDGIWAFAQDDVLRVKRLQRGLSKLTIISDNPQYAVEELPLDEADNLQLIGKCLWAGQSL